jgi:hypothetical protein
MSLSFSSFQQPLTTTTKINQQTSGAKPAFKDINYWLTSLIHNGEDITKNYERTVLSIMEDGTFDICNDLYCTRGTWQEQDGLIYIAINAADFSSDASAGPFDWMNGTWKIVEKSDLFLVIEKIDKDYWRAEFSTHGR